MALFVGAHEHFDATRHLEGDRSRAGSGRHVAYDGIATD